MAHTSLHDIGTADQGNIDMSTIIERLEKEIAAGTIIFDSAAQKRQLLNQHDGTKATRTLHELVLALVGLAGETIRISSVVREGDDGHHGQGRAVDIGNETIAGSLLPRVATDAKVAELKIDELIFDANVAGHADRNKWNYDRGVKHDYGSGTLNGHKNHIHFSVKA